MRARGRGLRANGADVQQEVYTPGTGNPPGSLSHAHHLIGARRGRDSAEGDKGGEGAGGWPQAEGSGGVPWYLRWKSAA